MPRHLLLLTLASALSWGQNDPSLATYLSFERDGANAGWGGTPPVISLDTSIVHGGKNALRIVRDASSPAAFSSVGRAIPVDFRAATITLRGFLKTELVSEYTGLWLRLDGENGPLAIDNMQAQQLRGTHDWSEYSVSLPLSPNARQIVFGVLQAGTGKSWADDLQLLADGKPVWEAPKVPLLTSALTQDKEFEGSSRIRLTSLNEVQVGNLATLGKVWGFLKYYDQRVVGAKHNWDFELFRITPKVLAATNRAQANGEMAAWIRGLGPVTECNPCRQLGDAPLYLSTNNYWIQDREALGKELSDLLVESERNRPIGEQAQLYLTKAPGVGNPQFRYEREYTRDVIPDSGYQLLALYRFWNAVSYWFPDRDLISDNWDSVLRRFIPRIALARDRRIYEQELMMMIAFVSDTHANLWSSLASRPPIGDCMIPVTLRFIGNSPVVSATTIPELLPGDVLTTLGGESVAQMVLRLHPYYAASNEPTILRDIAAYMTRGACGPVSLRIQRGQATQDVTVARTQVQLKAVTHDRPGATFQILSPEVAYLKLSSFKIADVPTYLRDAAGTKGMVVDIRNYPSEFAVFSLGQHFIDRETPFVRFTEGDLQNPGAFSWGHANSLMPEAPRYPGKVIVLVDEVTQSQAEYTTMAFRAAGAIVIGSTTGGADGNVSELQLPGGLRTMFSGIGVFYPDRRGTQRVGIVPDVEVKPTIAGIRDGRDELLEEAVRQIVGR